MFYDIYVDLCEKRGEKPYAAAKNIGLSSASSIINVWRTKGSTPRGDTLQKIADYFGVSVQYLLSGDRPGESETEKQTAQADGLSDAEAMLLSAFRRLTPEQQRLVLVQLQALAQLPADQAAAE